MGHALDRRRHLLKDALCRLPAPSGLTSNLVLSAKVRTHLFQCDTPIGHGS